MLQGVATNAIKTPRPKAVSKRQYLIYPPPMKPDSDRMPSVLFPTRKITVSFHLGIAMLLSLLHPPLP